MNKLDATLGQWMAAYARWKESVGQLKSEGKSDTGPTSEMREEVSRHQREADQALHVFQMEFEAFKRTQETEEAKKRRR
jgi:hypothetical protein